MLALRKGKVVSDIKMSECCTCGTKWRTGQDGSHSCSTKLKQDNDTLVAQNKVMKAALNKIKLHYEIKMPKDVGRGFIASYNTASKALEGIE